MLLETKRQEIRLLLAKNSSFDLCISKINQYKEQALSVSDENNIAFEEACTLVLLSTNQY